MNGDMGVMISMGLCKKDVTPLLTHWSYVFLALTHRYNLLSDWCNHLSMPNCGFDSSKIGSRIGEFYYIDDGICAFSEVFASANSRKCSGCLIDTTRGFSKGKAMFNGCILPAHTDIILNKGAPIHFISVYMGGSILAIWPLRRYGCNFQYLISNQFK